MHTMSVPLQIASTSTPPVPGTMPNVVLKGDTTVSAEVALNAFVDVLTSQFNTGSGFDVYTLYWKSSPIVEPTWIYAGVLTTAVGTSSAASNVAGQMVMTFRSLAGNHYRLQLMETVNTPNTELSAGGIAGESALAAIVNYLTGSTSCVVARDNAFLVGVLRMITKTNDALRHTWLV